MTRTIWRLTYTTTGTTTLAGIAGVAYCVLTDRPLGAIGCLALFLVGVIALRTAWEVDVLQRRRMRLAGQERLFEAERGVFERDIERARSALDAEEREMNEALDAERAKMRSEIAGQQDKMEADFANRRALLQREAFAKGFEMGENGVATEQRSADVIVLPVGPNSPTIMGTGTTNK